MRSDFEERKKILAWLLEYGPAPALTACRAAGLHLTSKAALKRFETYLKLGLVRGQTVGRRTLYRVIEGVEAPYPKTAGLLPEVEARLRRQIQAAHRDREPTLRDVSRGAGVGYHVAERMAKEMGLDFTYGRRKPTPPTKKAA